jgi:hypothetical protein
LQERAELAAKYLGSLNPEETKKALQAMENLFEKRLSLCITDRIQTMENNYGFVNGRPIQIDVGRIRQDPNLNTEEERARILHNFRSWYQDKFIAAES